jgi:glycine betaine/proline transport system permease protein
MRRRPTPGGGNESISSPAPADTDWLAASSAPADPATFDWLHPFQEALIPLNVWVDQGLDWLVDNFRPVFQAIRWPIDAILTSVESALQAAPALLVILIFVLLAWQMVGRRLAVGTLISLVIVGLIGAWSEAMVTLALVLTSVFFCVLVGLPLGIWLARNDRALAIFRPILDAMQTTTGVRIPGTHRHVVRDRQRPRCSRDHHLCAAAVDSPHQPGHPPGSGGFGGSRPSVRRQSAPVAVQGADSLGDAQHHGWRQPNAHVGAIDGGNRLDDRRGWFGSDVLRGIGRLDMGLATVGGVGIVLLAIILDRLTQSFGADTRRREARHWYQQGPAGLVYRLLARH